MCVVDLAKKAFKKDIKTPSGLCCVIQRLTDGRKAQEEMCKGTERSFKKKNHK